MVATVLMISADILRGRYRAAFDAPTRSRRARSKLYRFALPTGEPCFPTPAIPIMGAGPVELVSRLYESKPQTYVKNIFFATPADYQEVDVTDLRGAEGEFVDLPVSEAA